MTIGHLVRDLRSRRNWSQGQLAGQLCQVSGRSSVTREDVSRWERDKVIPGPFWLGHLATVFDTSRDALREAATLTRVDRRAFLSMAALTATHGTIASEIVAGLAGADSLALTGTQTTHGTDLLIATKVDLPVAARLGRWMHDGETAILRVNATGILAKLPGQAHAGEVARVLEHDDEVRELYTAAVVARVGLLNWTTARRIAREPLSSGRRLGYLARRLADEVLNHRDAGARWVSASLLRDMSPAL